MYTKYATPIFYRSLSSLIEINVKWTLLLIFVNNVTSEQKPFYNIAHMVNSIQEIEPNLDKGANALEADLYFAFNGTPILTYHGLPCDCFRLCNMKENFEDYLKFIQNITTPGHPKYRKELVLLFLDLKLSKLNSSIKVEAGKLVADRVINFLYGNNNTTSKINLILSIGHVYDKEFIFGFLNELEARSMMQLNDRIGWDVGLNDPLDMILNMWKKIGSVSNIWQGDGISNCLSPFHNTFRLTSAIQEKAKQRSLKGPYIRKVYQWTIDFIANIRSSLRKRVDAIITNYPERIVRILKEPNFAQSFRLADLNDDPWDLITEPLHNNDHAFLDSTWSNARIVSGIWDLLISILNFLKLDKLFENHVKK